MSARELILRRTLHEELASLLRTMIVEGDLRPGERIPEQALCERFGVSRTPLREALMVLSAERLVQLSPNRGASVVRVTWEDVAEILPLLGTLEGHGGALACRRIAEAGLSRLGSLLEQVAERHRPEDAEGYVLFCRDFADVVLEEAGNTTVSETYRRLQARVHHTYVASLHAMRPLLPARWRSALAERRQMLDALKARDGAAFRRLASEHVGYRVEIGRETSEPALVR